MAKFIKRSGDDFDMYESREEYDAEQSQKTEGGLLFWAVILLAIAFPVMLANGNLKGAQLVFSLGLVATGYLLISRAFRVHLKEPDSQGKGCLVALFGVLLISIALKLANSK